MGLFNRFDKVELPNGGFALDDGAFDHYYERDENGLMVQKPIKATDEEKRQVEIDGYRRGLAAVEHQLEHLDDPPLPWLDPPAPEHLERRRTELKNERAAILAQLERLEPSQKRKRLGAKV